MSDSEKSLFNAGKYKKYKSTATVGVKNKGRQIEVPIIGDDGSPTGEMETRNISTDALSVTTYFVDGSDSLANKGMTIGFEHVPTGKRVNFKAFITAFNETFSSDWLSENVYGRGDPIHMFRNTSRTISLAWKMPAATESEAYQNLGRLQSFIQFLYPTYTSVQNASTINQSPLVRLKLMNLAQKSSYRDSFEGFTVSSTGDTPGLLGIIKNVTINHNLDTDAGVFEMVKAENSHSAAKILPKVIEVNIDFGVVHEHTMGLSATTNVFGGKSDAADTKGTHGRYFPYNIDDSADGSGISYQDAVNSMTQFSLTASLAREQQHGYRMAESVVQQAVADYEAAKAKMTGILAGSEGSGNQTTAFSDASNQRDSAALQIQELLAFTDKIETTE